VQYPLVPTFRRAADGGNADAAVNLYSMYTVGRGVTRSKGMAMRWALKADENGDAYMCVHIAQWMYQDLPYAREIGHVEEAAGVAASAGVMEGHDVPPDVLTDVVHWLRKGGYPDPAGQLDVLRRLALEGGKYCRNEGCEVLGHPKEFKVCPQCKYVRYCSDACQKQDWTTGGHKAACGKPHWQNEPN
jgi:TPR repeat protein